MNPINRSSTTSCIKSEEGVKKNTLTAVELKKNIEKQEVSEKLITVSSNEPFTSLMGCSSNNSALEVLLGPEMNVNPSLEVKVDSGEKKPPLEEPGWKKLANGIWNACGAFLSDIFNTINLFPDKYAEVEGSNIDEHQRQAINQLKGIQTEVNENPNITGEEKKNFIARINDIITSAITLQENIKEEKDKLGDGGLEASKSLAKILSGNLKEVQDSYDELIKKAGSQNQPKKANVQLEIFLLTHDKASNLLKDNKFFGNTENQIKNNIQNFDDQKQIQPKLAGFLTNIQTQLSEQRKKIDELGNVEGKIDKLEDLTKSFNQFFLEFTRAINNFKECKSSQELEGSLATHENKLSELDKQVKDACAIKN